MGDTPGTPGRGKGGKGERGRGEGRGGGKGKGGEGIIHLLLPQAPTAVAAYGIGWGLWWEGFVQKVCFEFRVDTRMRWTVTDSRVMMGELSVDDWEEVA